MKGVNSTTQPCISQQRSMPLIAQKFIQGEHDGENDGIQKQSQPAGESRDSWFEGSGVTPDFMNTREQPDEQIRDAFYRHYGQFAISSITLLELIYGAEKSVNPEKNLAVIEGFSTRLEVQNYGFNADTSIPKRVTLDRQNHPAKS
ncbi:hypothetical protein ACIPT4_01100 [Pectobacterium jejuense]|uniref:hypothetical protein n=1 Tax=Pectobacterium jejuense TaxID=2974022 RepID=UPI0037FC3C90